MSRRNLNATVGDEYWGYPLVNFGPRSRSMDLERHPPRMGSPRHRGAPGETMAGAASPGWVGDFRDAGRDIGLRVSATHSME